MAKNQEPGMDDAGAQKDRQGLTTDIGYLTGQKEFTGVYSKGGPEVGNPYSGTLAGEDYNPVTYTDKDMPMPSTAKPTPGDFQEVKSSGGGQMATAPQNYGNNK